MPDTFSSLGLGPLGSKHCAPLLSTCDETYLRLLAEFCVDANILVPESVLLGEEFCVDRVDFRFRVDQEKAPDVLNIWCDFGPVDETDELKCYRALLERGTRYTGNFASTMAVCLETGWVLCCARVPLDTVSSTELFSYVQHLASEALLWQGRERTGSDAAGLADTPAMSVAFADELILLLLNYCRSVGWDSEAVEHILMGMPLIIDHVPLVVHKSEDMPVGLCSLYSDYGQLLERHNKSDFYRTLLTSNMLMFPALGESLMIAKASGHLLLRHDFSAQKMDAEALSGVMTEMAGKVRWWRTSHR